MENASKALVIAGSILVAIMIVSLGVIIFNNFSNSAKDGANLDEQEISEFNSKIIPYTGESISGSQVNTLINLVISNDITAIGNEDASKIVKITFPLQSAGGSAMGTIGVDKSSTPWKMQYPSSKRVATGASAYYDVDPTYGENGLINEIKVTVH